MQTPDVRDLVPIGHPLWIHLHIDMLHTYRYVTYISICYIHIVPIGHPLWIHLHIDMLHTCVYVCMCIYIFPYTYICIMTYAYIYDVICIYISLIYMHIHKHILIIIWQQLEGDSDGAEVCGGGGVG
jgi:hypothetical protein